jgi:hypothetical protein
VPDNEGAMTDFDFTLCSIPMLISRNNSEAYHDKIVSRYTVLMRFLKDNNLVYKEPLSSDGSLKMDLVLKKSDVTPQCLELFKKAIPAWHAQIDRSGKVDNVSKLIKAMEQIQT